MGYYIQTAQPKNKAAAIKQDFDAIEVTVDEAEFFIKEQMGAVVCVVDNGPFEAAAYCYNLDEFRAFTLSEDDRPKTWLYVENMEKVHEATGYKGALAR
jgi:hypothetical protein